MPTGRAEETSPRQATHKPLIAMNFTVPIFGAEQSNAMWLRVWNRGIRLAKIVASTLSRPRSIFRIQQFRSISSTFAMNTMWTAFRGHAESCGKAVESGDSRSGSTALHPQVQLWKGESAPWKPVMPHCVKTVAWEVIPRKRGIKLI